MNNFTLTVSDSVAQIVFDVPNRSMNTLTADVLREVGEIVERIRTDAAIKGAVISSGKASGFCAGADLGELGGSLAGGGVPDAKLFEAVFAINKLFRALETCGKPVAAAIGGVALGGGFELALACHHRVVADNEKIQLGLPEAKVGLLPGGGGTQRLPRLIGAMAALPLLLEGKSISPAEAKKMGLVHQVVPAEEIVAAATAWAAGGGDAVAPWDKKEFKFPGGGPYSPATSQVFMMGNAMLRKQSFGNYPAQINIMKAVYEGLQVPIDAALRIESRYFANTVVTPQAAGMIRTLFGSMDQLGKGAARPKIAEKFTAKKVAVLGAGMMGAGIAYVQAAAGIETVLIDVSQEAAEKGKEYSKKLVDKAVGRGKMTREKADALLALITPTTDYEHIRGSDLIVEAVFEDRALKADITKRAEAYLADNAVFGSNTSTLPITSLAEASVRPGNFIGIHFFSPVDRMGLVEIIMGAQTSQETLAKSVDYVMKIRKTPIVVNDSRGFYTSRCFATFIQEGLELLTDGVAPAIIDNVGRATGMPRGPLEMHDDVALDLSLKVRTQTKKDLGDAFVPNASDPIIEKMVTELGRFGRKNGKGFYDYQADGTKKLWPGLAELAPVSQASADAALVAEIRKRLLYRQAVEAARCMQENVVTSAREADVGAILGWGFAPWTGGPLSLIDGIGVAKFVAECDALAQKFGARFAPPQLLRDMAERGESFYGTATAKAA
jgi:3-hydroxyacyl-CoA dehydrogenase/enoyl-CoA hydratase/3-hydroxybutyryl-CoA epimerase